ncbi:hypothetical protein [Cupriavidus necator]
MPGYRYRSAGTTTVGVQVLTKEEDGKRRYTYHLEIRRPGQEPKTYGQRVEQNPFDDEEQAYAAGWKEAERMQIHGLV